MTTVKDTYENRAAFLVSYFGAPSGETQERFPEWLKQVNAKPVNSVDEALWFAEFAEKAIQLRNQEQTK